MPANNAAMESNDTMEVDGPRGEYLEEDENFQVEMEDSNDQELADEMSANDQSSVGMQENVDDEETDNYDEAILENQELFQRPEGFDQKYLMNARNRWQNYDQHRVDHMERDKELQSDVALLKLLQGHPLSLFESIRQWRHDSEFVYQHQMEYMKYAKKTRAKVLGDLEKMYDMASLRPKQRRLRLPHTGAIADLVVFPFGEMFRHMLSNPVIMCQENLLFDMDDPFVPPSIGGGDNKYGDVNTGSLFVEAYEERCRVRNLDIMAGIIAFVDKSHLDNKGKLTLEPFMVTFGFFKREFRNKPEAWFPLGYLPNMNHVAPHADPDNKMKDYHYCLEIILSEMVQYQKLNGIYWKLPQPKKQRFVEVRIHIPLLYVIGDTEGHDYLCGRKVDRMTGTSNQCRMCNVSHQECDNPDAEVELTERALIATLRSQEMLEALDHLSYKCIKDAFSNVEFADMTYGIHQGTPAECLHAINLGLQERVIACIFLMKRVKKVKQNGSTQQGKKQSKSSRSGQEEDVADAADEEEWEWDTEDSMVFQPPEEQDYSTRGIFDKKTCERIDQRCKALNNELRWQSDTEIPRTNFPTGISSLAKMTGNERNGVLLMLLLVITMDSANYQNKVEQSRALGRSSNPENRTFRPDEHGYISYCMRPELKRNIIKHVSLLILLDSFVRSKHIPVAKVEAMERFVKLLVHGIVRTFPRSKGTGHKTIKTHLVSHHLVAEIRRSGSLQNSNSGPCESNHIENVKIVGENTQKRAATFATQVATQAHNKRVIDFAYKDHPKWKSDNEDSDANKLDAAVKVGPTKYSVGMTSVYCGTTRKTNVEDELLQWDKSGIKGREILSLIRQKILPYLPENDFVTLHFWVEKSGEKYHANPSYGMEKLPKQHWALINEFCAGESRTVGFHIQVVLGIESHPTRQGGIALDCGSLITRSGQYMIGHRLTKVLQRSGYDEEWDWDFGSLAEENQPMIHMAKKETVSVQEDTTVGLGTRRYAIIAIPVEWICDTLIGIRDPAVEDTVTQDYYFLESPTKWGDIFMEVGEKETKQD